MLPCSIEIVDEHGDAYLVFQRVRQKRAEFSNDAGVQSLGDREPLLLYSLRAWDLHEVLDCPLQADREIAGETVRIVQIPHECGLARVVRGWEGATLDVPVR